MNTIIGIPLQDEEKGDTITWEHTDKGKFSVKKAYKFLQETENFEYEPTWPWNKIWDLQVQPRIKIFC